MQIWGQSLGYVVVRRALQNIVEALRIYETALFNYFFALPALEVNGAQVFNPKQVTHMLAVAKNSNLLPKSGGD